MPDEPTQFSTSAYDRAQIDRIANAARDVNIYEAHRSRNRPGQPTRLFGTVPLVVADFVQRDDLLRGVSEPAVSVVAAVHGIGGVGKSQLAAKYFNDRQRDFDCAAWIDMRDRHGRPGFEAIAKAFDLIVSSESDGVETARNFIKGSSDSWLLVFDNCEHPSHLDDLLPQSPNAKVIVTSRYRHWEGYASSVMVDVFDADTANSYLCQRAQQQSSADSKALAKALGQLPLALSLAGSYCLREQINFATYSRQLGPHVVQGLRSTDPSETDRAIRGIWEQSLTAAVAAQSEARPVLEILSVLDWTDIGREWFLSNNPTNALRTLYEYSLIELSPASVAVRHNLIADGVASSITDRKTIREALTAIFSGAIRVTGADLRTASDLAEPIRHLKSVTSRNPHLVTPALLPILNQAVWQLQEQGSSDIDFAQTVYQLSRTLAGPGDRDTLGAALRLAAAWWAAGEYEKAANFEYPTLMECEKSLGADHPQTMMARNNLAASCARAGRPTEALEHGERAYRDRQRVLGKTHVQTLNSANNLANRYAALGRNREALDLDLTTCALRREVLGDIHADTLMSRNNLAASHSAMNELQVAVDIDRQNHVDSQQVLGPLHPDTLTSQHNLSIRHGLSGDVTTAVSVAEQVKMDRERTLGYDHPDTVASRTLLSHLRSDVLSEEDKQSIGMLSRRLEALDLEVFE